MDHSIRMFPPHLRTNESIRTILPGADSGSLKKSANPRFFRVTFFECFKYPFLGVKWPPFGWSKGCFMEYLGILFCFLGVNMITRIKGLGKKVTVISNLEGNPLCDVCGLETKRVKVCFHGSSPRAPKCSIAIGELYSILDSKLLIRSIYGKRVSASNFWEKNLLAA